MTDSKVFLPLGVQNPSRRHLTNSGIKDESTIEKYGAETNGDILSLESGSSPAAAHPFTPTAPSKKN
jgi:hypothetical protein